MAAKGSKLTAAQKRRVSLAVKRVWRQKRLQQKQKQEFKVTPGKVVEIPLGALGDLHDPMKVGGTRVAALDDQSISRLGQLIAAVWTALY